MKCQAVFWLHRLLSFWDCPNGSSQWQRHNEKCPCSKPTKLRFRSWKKWSSIQTVASVAPLMSSLLLFYSREVRGHSVVCCLADVPGFQCVVSSWDFKPCPVVLSEPARAFLFLSQRDVSVCTLQQTHTQKRTHTHIHSHRSVVPPPTHRNNPNLWISTLLLRFSGWFCCPQWTAYTGKERKKKYFTSAASRVLILSIVCLSANLW